MIAVSRLDMKLGTTVALADVSMDVAEGEMVVVLGPSGCGKSTLLRAIAGLAPSAGGEIRIDGEVVCGTSADRSLVFQGDALLPWRSVLANVELPLELRGIPRRERRRKATGLLDEVGLGGFERHRPGQISGGMQQRVQIARTLVGNPRVVLMDEPFSALDARTRANAQGLLLEVCRKRRSTVIFVTHDVDEALLLADRIVVLSERPGRVRACFDVSRLDAHSQPDSHARRGLRDQILGLLQPMSELDAPGTAMELQD